MGEAMTWYRCNGDMIPFEAVRYPDRSPAECSPSGPLTANIQRGADVWPLDVRWIDASRGRFEVKMVAPDGEYRLRVWHHPPDGRLILLMDRAIRVFDRPAVIRTAGLDPEPAAPHRPILMDPELLEIIGETPPGARPEPEGSWRDRPPLL